MLSCWLFAVFHHPFWKTQGPLRFAIQIFTRRIGMKKSLSFLSLFALLLAGGLTRFFERRSG